MALLPALRETWVTLAIGAAFSVTAPGSLIGQADSGTRPTTSARGTIVDPMGAAIEGAEVSLRPRGPSVQSAADGSFILRRLPQGRFSIGIRRVGYFPIVLEMDLANQPMWVGKIVLTPGAFRLPEIEVAARNTKPAQYAYTTKYDDFFRRRRLGLGTFVSREDIDRRRPARTAEILQMIPGVHVDIQPRGLPTRVTFARCNERPPKISVWINGQRLIPEGGDPEGRSLGGIDMKSQGMVGEMLDRIDPAEIELVEVYRGAGQIPGEFAGNACAAIVIWTR